MGWRIGRGLSLIRSPSLPISAIRGLPLDDLHVVDTAITDLNVDRSGCCDAAPAWATCILGELDLAEKDLGSAGAGAVLWRTVVALSVQCFNETADCHLACVHQLEANVVRLGFKRVVEFSAQHPAVRDVQFTLAPSADRLGGDAASFGDTRTRLADRVKRGGLLLCVGQSAGFEFFSHVPLYPLGRDSFLFFHFRLDPVQQLLGSLLWGCPLDLRAELQAFLLGTHDVDLIEALDEERHVLE